MSSPIPGLVDERWRGALRESPMPRWIDPMLATLTSERFDSPEWIYEHKLDGERCLAYVEAGTVRLRSRNDHPIDASYPEIAAAFDGAAVDVIVDGEVVAIGEDGVDRFELLQHRMQLQRPAKALATGIHVEYHVFDILWAGGYSTLELPVLERKAVLRGVVTFGERIVYVDHRSPDGVAYYQEACRRGWEGLIAKRIAARYQPGKRSKDWLKFKCVANQELVIGGFTDPKGSRVGFGALLVGYHDADHRLRYAGKVGTGFDERTLRELRSVLDRLERPEPPFAEDPDLPRRGVHWVEPRLVAEVAFSEWTDSGKLRHPRFQGLRRDKPASSVVREIPR